MQSESELTPGFGTDCMNIYGASSNPGKQLFQRNFALRFSVCSQVNLNTEFNQSGRPVGSKLGIVAHMGHGRAKPLCSTRRPSAAQNTNSEETRAGFVFKGRFLIEAALTPTYLFPEAGCLFAHGCPRKSQSLLLSDPASKGKLDLFAFPQTDLPSPESSWLRSSKIK